MADTITAKVFRYDPSCDDAPYYTEYEVPYDDEDTGFMTGLQVLHYIYENYEPIAYDFNCRGSLCGRCSMVIDGTPGLACYTPLQPGEHTFEPLAGLPIVRDLIVDRAAYVQKFVGTGIAKQTVNPITQSDPIDYDLYWNTLEYLNNCRECMCCYDVCPALNDRNQWDYVGPGAMMQIAFRHLDPYDEEDRIRQAVFSGLWNCDLCGICSTVCPAEIDHVSLLTMLQQEAEAAGLKPDELPTSNTIYGVATDDADEGATTETIAAEARDAETIIAESCSTSGCHSTSLLEVQLDEETATSRVTGHALAHDTLTEEEREALIAFLTGE